MKKSYQFALVLTSLLSFYNFTYATNIPNTDNPITFLGPTARLSYTSTLNNTTAYSVAGDLGIRNARIDGTFGFKMHENQYFKLSGEYLWQRIIYPFFSGNSNQWINQGAVGAAYQYNFLNYRFAPEFDLNGYYAHASSKTLNNINGTFTNQGITQSYTNKRRIAGSDTAGMSPGIAIMLWHGGKVGAAVNYDGIRYDTRNVSNENSQGFGGTLSLRQAFTDDVNLNLAAAFKQPFNNYAANLNWSYTFDPLFGKWMLGLFGEYTVGKNTLPNTYNAGIIGNYFFDQRCECIPVVKRVKGKKHFTNKVTIEAQPLSDNLLPWTVNPAIYMPQVLAINDDHTL